MRRLIDAPSHTAREHAELLADFRNRLEQIVSYCRQIGALPILVPPPGNDAGFEPNRSILPPETPRAEREAFALAFQEARAREKTDPAGSIAAYRLLIERQPGFAESHFRLARLLEARGDDEEAYRRYIAARDLDGHPFRCLTSFQDVYRELASRYEAILVDGQAVFHARHPHGMLDDYLFNDGFHPSLEGHVALAEAILKALQAQGGFRLARGRARTHDRPGGVRRPFRRGPPRRGRTFATPRRCVLRARGPAPLRSHRAASQEPPILRRSEAAPVRPRRGQPGDTRRRCATRQATGRA